MKAVVAAFNQEKALVEAFYVITNLQMDFFEALAPAQQDSSMKRVNQPINVDSTEKQMLIEDCWCFSQPRRLWSQKKLSLSAVEENQDDLLSPS